MTQPDVVVCIEHVARELDIACALRSLARARHGLSVDVLVMAQDLEAALAIRRPQVAVVPFCCCRQDFGVRNLLRRCPGVPVVNLAFEQLLSAGNRAFRLPHDEVAREDVLHLAAGDFFAEWLLESGVVPRNVLKIGSIAYQMYRQPYRAVFESRRAELAKAHNLDPERPWVFFPENFSAAFMSPAHIRLRLRYGYDRHALQAYVDYARGSFEDTAQWCREAAELGHVELVLRPRPALSKSVFLDALRDKLGPLPGEHFHVIKDGSVREWILASQIVVSTYSSTLVEAALAGKPSYLLAPRDIPESAGVDWHAAASKISTRETFLDLMESPARAESAGELARWAEERFLSQGDALGNLTGVLAEITAGVREAPRLRHMGSVATIKDHLQGGLKKLERHCRGLLRPRRRRVFGHECDHVTTAEIEHRTHVWDLALGHATAGGEPPPVGTSTNGVLTVPAH
jgi:surface carbohydrate biosynthesis protein